MSLLVRNQQNNWAYIIVLVVIALLVGIWTVSYALDTIQEINALSQ